MFPLVADATEPSQLVKEISRQVASPNVPFGIRLTDAKNPASATGTRCGDSASPKGVPNAVEFDIDRQTREFASAVNALSQEILDPRRQAMSDENALAFLAFPNEIQQADDERINRAYGIHGERTILCRCRTMIPASDHFN